MDAVSDHKKAARRLSAPFRMAGALALALSLGGCLGYDGTVQHGYVLDAKALEQVKVGASAEQVLTVMGTPSTTSTIGAEAWYYITQVAHHMEGEAWRRWNDQLRDVLPREQAVKGKHRGSWDPSLDRWGHIGGRLFVTSFCVYMLETYYRHLPLYAAQQAEGQ